MPQPSRFGVLVARADRLAVQAAERPGPALAGLLALNLAAAACFVGMGLAVGDKALMFRELAPGTWLSFSLLLFIAAVAWGVHRRSHAGERWHASFWGLSAVVFLVFAFDEITQFMIFVSHGLEEAFELAPAAGFHDLEAVLLTLLFAFAALLLLPRVSEVFDHPEALLVLSMAACLGATSQTLDSIAPATPWEFVAEETFKLSAEAFFVGGFLLVLRDVLQPDEVRARAAI